MMHQPFTGERFFGDGAQRRVPRPPAASAS